MNIGWLKIIGATLFELVWVTGLKYAELPWQWGYYYFDFRCYWLEIIE